MTIKRGLFCDKSSILLYNTAQLISKDDKKKHKSSLTSNLKTSFERLIAFISSVFENNRWIGNADLEATK